MNAKNRDLNTESLSTIGPATNAAMVTPSDTEDLEYTSRRLYIGGAGDVTILTAGGDLVTYRNVPAGSYLQVRTNQVHAKGTTATDIVSEY